MDMRKYLDPARSTRRWITAGLVMGGAVAGALLGVLLTPLGKLVAGAPPADTANYLVNAGAFAMLGALAAPVVTWLALRHVPLWRTVAEPLAGAIMGGAIGVLMGSGALFLALVPGGALAAATRLAVARRRRSLSSPF